MLAWLKKILGDQYTEEIDTKVSDEIGKGFVARADFNEANESKKQLEGQVKGYETQIADRDKQLEDLKAVDADGMQAKIKELEEANKASEKTRKKEAEETAATHKAELAKLSRQAETREFMGKQKFVNDLTRDALSAKLEDALVDPANAGKSRQELLDGMVVGEDGKPRADIFLPPDNPNKLNLPPVGQPPAAKDGVKTLSDALNLKYNK
jgi:hypothetical protein